MEVGQFGYACAEFVRIQAAWRARVRREALASQGWAALCGLVVGGLAGAVVGSQSTPWGGVWPALVLLAGFMAWPWRRFAETDPVVRAWAGWSHTWCEMAQALRIGLDSDWTICWDRRVPGWADPVTIAIGATGVWGLWVAPPGTAMDPDHLALQISTILAGDEGGPVVRVQMVEWATPATQWRHTVTQMVCGVLWASPGDCLRMVSLVKDRTMEDPEMMRRG